VRRLIIALVVALGSTYYAAAQHPTTANDLRAGKFFSRPITQLEIVLVNLKAAAKEIASFHFKRDQKLQVLRDFREPDGDAGFVPELGRVVLALTLHVSEMADPWREVCDATVARFYGWFYFPPKEGWDRDSKLRMMEKYFGEAVRLDAENAKAAVDTFLDSIMVRVVFTVPTEDRKKLKWHRTCTKDSMTGMTTYTEHRYPTD
jgi:hypothetical protein